MQRHDVAPTLRWRCINVICPLGSVLQAEREREKERMHLQTVTIRLIWFYTVCYSVFNLWQTRVFAKWTWSNLVEESTSLAKDERVKQSWVCGLGGLVVRALDFHAGYRGFESRLGRDNFQTISTSSSYSTYPGSSIMWTGRRLVTHSGTKCAWVIHESKVVQIHVHNNRRCLHVPRVRGSVKNPHNNNSLG